MLWVRGLIFTLLVPGAVGFFIPSAMIRSARPQPGIWGLGWMLVAAGTLIYGWCLVRFLSAGGTPAIFFSRHLRFLIGQEPDGVVSCGLYSFSRNPMYLGVLAVVFGQAILYRSILLMTYGCAVFVLFHIIVVLAEEPHLRTTRGAFYETYCRAVPRWLGVPRRLRRRPSPC